MPSSLDDSSEAVADMKYQVVTTRLPSSISSTEDQFFSWFDQDRWVWTHAVS